ETTALVNKVRAPFEADLAKVLGRTESLLYRRGNFNGTFDDVICDALLEEREADIALSPGFRWGTSVLPGQEITVEDLYSATGMTYPAAYRMEMTGARIKEILEDVADNLFNADPYYQQGGDMVRVGGMGYRIDVGAKMGSRISEMTLLKSKQPIDAAKNYVVAGWASVNEGTEGPPIWDVVSKYIKRKGTIKLAPNRSVKVAGL
ncbi:MAG TPA: 5'-nucleotidase C-terminal domain-containing protein, partial [Hyphomicrobiaceae bacterium]|nr:5'-nucleotidase C-terminal domain-containing protein [Hyphomicrobiaceae bacterium]